MRISLNTSILDPDDDSQFHLGDPEVNRRLAATLRSRGTSLTVLDLPMWIAPTTNGKMLAWIVDDRIAYCSVFQVRRFVDHREVTQSNVWSNPNVAKGLARRVMRDHYLAGYGAMSSSLEVYRPGYLMWMRFLRENFHYVYAAADVVFHRFHSFAEFERDVDLVFGVGLNMLHNRVVVSLSELEDLCLPQ